MNRIWRDAAVAGVMGCAAVLAGAAPVDLGTWQAESYPAVSGFPAGIWQVQADGSSVTQIRNGQPTFFHSDFDAMGTDVRGTVRVVTSSDDDYIGFALGFDPGDSTSASADYLLIDWKQATQDFNFGTPSFTPGSNAPRGLAVSRVTGIPTADEFWGHVDFAENPAGGLSELQRGSTLGSTGWATGVDYVFRFVFVPNRLQVYVNEQLELDVAGSFANGRLAFYNFSQENVRYSAFDVAPAVPEPSAVLMALLGAGVATAAVRRRHTVTARHFQP